ncbi:MULTISPECIES: LamG-like jellyroll fold domain-containing protein [unclassified Cellvibrio]|uniref:LamG-like jellyroll fold domain-containing protein n=1 Tax=unclassified Cellvibrio TaxID=2624793 RepID=UPI0012469438|nr:MULTISPECIES: LamG-like jellyroll fold domain-containing protein [unclassified Cellvibrio]QEY14914.1 cycloinulo-oligosaccharide fructanotransferase [Cellvibrio sp. KY-GH-1]UUA73810.1 FecR domain-containing protein [Cellvibrio sp. QJXJ]
MRNHDEQLIADYIAGEKVESQLAEAIAKNPDLLNKLASQRVMHRQLSHLLNENSTDDFVQKLEQKLNSRYGDNSQSAIRDQTVKIFNIKRHWYALAAAISFLSFLFLLKIFSPEITEVGAVYRVVSAISSGKPLTEGQKISSGPFSLSQGYAEITLKNGVRLLLEAPMSVDILSDEHLLLRRGKLVANVPPAATGFKVDTPSSSIIDLGTEFGVSVEDDGKSQVHVLTGEVKVRASTDQPYQLLVKDQARAFDLQQQVINIQNNPNRFMRSLPGRSIAQPNYLHWSFDDLSQQEFSCIGTGIDGKCYNAKVNSLNKKLAGISTVPGKFGNAVNFDGENSWLATAYKGIGGHKPRTVAFWLKAPKDFSLSQGFGILNWGLSDVQSAWQISLNPLAVSGPLGRIRIGTNQGEIVGTTDLRDDNWHHLAIVLFGGKDANLSTHVLIYVDGNLEYSDHKSIAKVFTDLNHPNSKPLTMGRNIAFDDQNTNQNNRFFRGQLDELYIFDSALDEPQIKNLMKKNTVGH